MTSFVRNLLVVMLLLGIIVGATLYADTIRSTALQIFSSSGAQVLGIHTKQFQQSSVSKQVHADVQNTLKVGENQLLQINVGDIITSFSQAQKIVRDVSSVTQLVHQQLQNLAK